MHSPSRLLRRSPPLIGSIILTPRKGSHHRHFSIRSQPSISSLSSSSASPGVPNEDGSCGRTNAAEYFVPLWRWFSSGLMVVGSGLGLSYWASNPAHADHDTTTEGSRFQDAPPQKKPTSLFKDDYRKRVFFKYEERLRLQSPPEKVFEYFASVKSGSGEVFMTPSDLLRAVIPVFPPSESNYVRGGNLMGEESPGELQCPPSNFFMLFDTDNDGLISFSEYIFFVTLLSIPESSFTVAFKMFDIDHNGEIDREEFQKVMALMRMFSRQGKKHSDGKRFGFKSTVLTNETGGMIEYFFGKDGKNALPIDKFVQFLRDLHEELLRLEFAHYDYKSRGTISAKDFALSMVASADTGNLKKFLDRVDELNDNHTLKNVRITYEEFKGLANLRKNLRLLSLALFSQGEANGFLTRRDFQRAASYVCGISLSKNVVDIIFHIFDSDRDGSLSSDEFLRVLQRRDPESAPPGEGGIKGLICSWFGCTC